MQASAVHGRLSSQLYVVPPHTPAVQTSLLVHKLPSLHAAPLVFAVHPVALVAAVHCWHWLLGLTAPFT